MKSSACGAFLLLLLLKAQCSLAQQTTTFVIQATKVQRSPKTTSQQSAYAGQSNSPQDTGAQGTDTSSFKIGLGGLIAIIVVVVAVVVFGILSVVFYVVAKRRNWQVRASIKRASRRLTGRREITTRSEVDRRKRSGMVGVERKPGTTPAPVRKHEPVSQVKDVEKGKDGGDVPKETKDKTRRAP